MLVPLVHSGMLVHEMKSSILSIWLVDFFISFDFRYYSYNSVTGALNTTFCTPGTFNPLQLQTACSLCSPGKFSAAGASACTSALPGMFTNATGSTAAYTCSPGSYINTTGATTCLPCPWGTHAQSSGSSICSLCAAGRFGNASGVTTAKCSGLCSDGYLCAPGSTSASPMPCPGFQSCHSLLAVCGAVQVCIAWIY
jgi:hypothetical protein